MIRYGKDKDYELAKNIWRESFTDSEEEINFYFNTIYKKENFLILEENEEIKASLHENPYNINFNNYLLPSFYIVAVAVSPEYRGKGYMKKILTHSLINGKNRGKDIVFLSPINTEIYSKFGFGYISELEHYYIKLNDIPFNNISKEIEIKKVTENDFSDLVILYEKKMCKNHIYLQRDKKYFERIKKEIENENGKIYAFYNNNEIAGYLMVYFRDDELFVREFFYLSIETAKTMLAFLKSFKEYYSNLEISAPQGSNLNFLIPNQLSIKKVQAPYILARILNVKNILSYLDIKGYNLKLKVNDNIIDENNGVFLINTNGKIEKIKDENNWNIEIDIKDLSSLLSGYIDIEDLLELEKIKIQNISVDNLKKIFKKQKNYIHEYQ